MSIKILFKQTAIYGISTIVLRMANWLLTPYYTRQIDDVSIGINADLMAMIAFVNIVYMLGMETSYFRFIKDRNESHVFQVTETTVFINSLFWSTVFVILATPIVNLLQYPGKEIYVYLLTGGLFLENMCNIPFAVLRNEGKAGRFMTIKGANILINIALNILFISFVMKGKISCSFYHSEDPVVWILIANLIPWALTFLLFSKSIFKHLSLAQFDLIKEISKYSTPLILVGMAGMVNETMNRVLLKNLLPYDLTRNLKELAMFNVNYKLAIIMTLAIQAFRMGAEPFFFKESKEKNSRKTYAVIMDFFIIACCIIMVLTSINREIIGSINHARYLEGVKILPLILLANLFLGIYYNASIWFKLTDNTRKGAWISIMGAVITIGFNWLLIPIMGYEGSALATLLCYSSMALVSLFWGQRVFPIPYDFKYNFLWIAMSTAYTYVVFDLFRGSVLALIMSSIVFLAIAAYFCLLRWRFSKTYLTQDA